MNRVTLTKWRTTQPLGEKMYIYIYMNEYNLNKYVLSDFYNSQKSRNNPNVHQQENEQKNWRIHAMKFYTAIKRANYLIHAETQVNLTSNMLHKRKQIHDRTYYMILFIRHLGREQTKWWR